MQIRNLRWQRSTLLEVLLLNVCVCIYIYYIGVVMRIYLQIRQRSKLLEVLLLNVDKP
jgi:hypothetical protein